MAFTLKGTTCEKCEELVWEDTVGTYNDPDNLLGYGAPGGAAPASPADYTSYTLQIWKPLVDINGVPSFTYDLLANLPAPDADGHYEWPITATALGEPEPMTSGVWYLRATAVWNGVTYYADCMTTFVIAIQGNVDGMLRSAPVPATDEQLAIWEELQLAISNGCCGYTEKSQARITWLLLNWNKCVC